mgnify:CR=1 FL=1
MWSVVKVAICRKGSSVAASVRMSLKARSEGEEITDSKNGYWIILRTLLLDGGMWEENLNVAANRSLYALFAALKTIDMQA